MNSILSDFRIPLDYSGIEPREQGYINRSFAIIYQGEPLYFLQQISTEIFPDIGALMYNLQQALPYLKDPAYTGPELIKTKDNAPYLRTENSNCWRLMTYVPNSTSYRYCPDVATAREAGRILGVFHRLMQQADPVDFKESLPGFHNLELRIKQFESALKRAQPDRKIQAAQTVALAREMARTLLTQVHDALPLRVCHNDTKMSNFLFSKTSGMGLCLVDLDTIMPGYFHYDFGDALRTIANAAPEEESDPERIIFNREYCEAFMEGLSREATFLSREELNLLPFGLHFMPFLHGVRALTDYLLGDVYYQVEYPQQNLERAKGMFRFASLAKAQTAYLSSLVDKYFSPI